MKKTLLLSSVLLASLMNAQVLESDTYDSYPVGNVSTAMTAPGVGGINLFGGSVTDYQIVKVDAAHGNSLQLIGGAGVTAGDVRYAFKTTLGAAWIERDAGNEIITGSLEIYTGTATGAHRFGSVIYDNTGIGIVGIMYNSSTKAINGLARLTNNSTATVNTYAISGLSATVFPANTWVKVGYSYDTVNGVITFTINGTTSTLNISGYTVVAGLTPDEHDINMPYLQGNTDTMTASVDNVTISAVKTTQLGTRNVGAVEVDSDFKIYPNPVTDVLLIDSKLKFKNAQIFDMTGKVINKKLDGNKLNVKDLPKGIYILKLENDGGVVTKKFIKK